MEEKEYYTITIDNVKYSEVDTITYNNNNYVFFADLDNPENFCIRKLVKENEEEFFEGLNSKEEFDTLLNLFMQKYTN